MRTFTYRIYLLFIAVFIVFYCRFCSWLNTTMIENRTILTTNDLDGFDKRKLPSPGFQVEVVVVDYNPDVQARPQTESTTKPAEGTTPNPPSETSSSIPKDAGKIENLSNETQNLSLDNSGPKQTDTKTSEPKVGSKTGGVTSGSGLGGPSPIGEVSDFKAMAADASVFTFGDDEDFESDGE
ncbi:hypothetical protein HanLR1_Chr04g0161941 [Helianthus annuus]|nr:hypothetical protein HanLR1_Chr04g0161941 [Helianthus annuus]